ncbi:fungal-specific transcription factor domain-containing protein [Mycena galericulata]|nr:fungal-specific transcription factor domain-containing protein [Mycena galericulata]
MSSDEEESTPLASDPQSAIHKTRRQHRSCDVCRHRKIRCDGMPGGQCSNCLSFGCPCTFVKPSKKRGPPKDKLVDVLRHQIATLQAKLRNLSICSLCAQPLQSGSDRPRPAASLFQQDTPASDTAPTDTNHPPAEEDYSPDELANRFSQISITGFDRTFFGPGSSYELVGFAIAVKEKLLGRPSKAHSRRQARFETLPWEQKLYDQLPHYVYPENDLIASLVGLYFTNVHPTVPILHRPAFERSVAEGLHLKDPKFGALLLAVLGVASTYSDDPRVFIDGNTLSSGWKFVAQVEIIHKLFDPSIYEVQFYCLMSLFAIGTSNPQMSWLYLGLGVRYLQYRGAHRQKRDGHNFEAELWNRAFWSLFLVDRMTCGFTGRPTSFNVEDFDVEPPLEVDDEYWEVGFTQPLGKPSRVSFLVHLLRLCEILGDAMRRVYASAKWKSRMGWTGPEWEQATVAELDSAMNKFLDSLPPHLRWNPDNHQTEPFSHQSAVLYMTFYYIQIIIHRPFIHKATSLAAPSLSICTNAARSALRIADIWMTRMHGLPSCFVQTPVFVSAVILIMSSFGSKRGGLSVDSSKDLAQVAKGMDMLNFAASRWQTAGRLCALVQELQSLELYSTHSGAPSVEQSNVLLTERPSPFMPSAWIPGPSATFSGVTDQFYAQDASSFEPGTSIEQLLADAAPSEQGNDWTTSSDPANDIVLDDEVMSMWMAVPTDFTNMLQWDAYIENMNTGP